MQKGQTKMLDTKNSWTREIKRIGQTGLKK